MFSKRTHWDLTVNRVTRALEAYRASGRALIDLTVANPTQVGLVPPARLLESALTAPGIRSYRPEPRGDTGAREAVARYYAARGSAVEPGQIVLTASTSEAYAHLFKLLADPGDQVLVPRPSYPLFEFLARLESVDTVPYDLAWEGRWVVDAACVRRAAGPRARAIVVVSPNNPTGNGIGRAELTALEEICRERSMALVADEVFGDYMFAARPDAVRTVAGSGTCLTVALGGLSKALGLPQVKVGWMAVTGPRAIADGALERLEVIADTYLSVATPSALSVTPLLASIEVLQAPILERVTANRLWLLDRARSAREAPWRVLPIEGGWYAVVEVPRTCTEEDRVLALLETAGVLVQPGYYFDFPRDGYLIVSLLADPASFTAAMSRVLTLLSDPGAPGASGVPAVPVARAAPAARKPRMRGASRRPLERRAGRR